MLARPSIQITMQFFPPNDSQIPCANASNIPIKIIMQPAAFWTMAPSFHPFL